jgi:hypothetical protein
MAAARCCASTCRRCRASADQPLIEQFWTKLNEWFFAIGYNEQKEYAANNGTDFEEIRAALNGATVSVVRVNKKKEIIVAVAVPVQRFRAVQGALVLTTPGGEIDTVLREDLRIILFIFMFTALVTIMLVAVDGRSHRRADPAAVECCRRGEPRQYQASRDSGFLDPARRNRSPVRLAARHDQVPL